MNVLAKRGFPVVRLVGAMALSGCVASVGVSGRQSHDLELAPLFAGYERGCEIADKPAERLLTWANPDERGRVRPVAALPEPWRSHARRADVLNRPDHWLVTVPLRRARFHGIRVVHLERWYGKGNGISGWALVLDAPLADARRRLNEPAFASDESDNFKPELLADDNPRYTRLTCDVSM